MRAITKRIAWFAALYAGSILALGVLALAAHAVMRRLTGG